MKKYIIIVGVIELILLVGLVTCCITEKKQNIEEQKQMCWVTNK
jgi:hypothetical protein